MIECRSGPVRGGVALVASLRDTRLGVIRVVGVLEVFQVAIDASRVRTGQAVVVIDMALRALHGRVHPGKREAGGRVVERRVHPRSRGVTLLATCREAGLNVVWIRGAIELRHVARGAVGGRPDELAIDMALRAGYGHVSASQRKLRKGVVIEGGRVPGGCAMAGLARLREASLDVRRIIRLVEVVEMAADTSSRGASVLTA